MTKHIAVPDDWQLVPKEPTPEMVEAGAAVDPERASVWDAMLAAAPQHPATTDKETCAKCNSPTLCEENGPACKENGE